MYTSLDMPVMELVLKIAKGNPGAASVLGMLMKDNAKVDPDSMFAEMSTVFGLDNEEIYGPDIWVLYKDICGRNIVKVIAVMRAVQLGMLSPRDVKGAIAAPRSDMGSQLDTDAILKQVQGRLPAFGQ
jgi:hypothetical protein